MAATSYVLAEYIWIGGKGELRSKTKVIHGKTEVKLEDLSSWNFDGSSTEQAPGEDSEVIIVPRAVYPDPFRRGGNHVLVITDTYTPKDEPLPTNTRYGAAKLFEQQPEQEPWFGIEQEYTLFKDGKPLGWPSSKARSLNPLTQIGFPAPQGPYYCSAGADRSFGRDLVEMHLEYCLYAGLTISGINAEVMPGQWEYQVGPCTGIESGDMMIASRYILNRCGEKFGVNVSIEPKPIPGDWNGAGCHTNFSTKAMREVDGSLEAVIIPAIEGLGKRHDEHIAVYGEGNDQRLTGRHETGRIDQFSYGVANRGASIRIPNSTAQAKKGYFEDRRPASNMDPYVVASMIYDSAVLRVDFNAAAKVEKPLEKPAMAAEPEAEKEAFPKEPVKADKDVAALEAAEKTADKKVEEVKEAPAPTATPPPVKKKPAPKAEKKKKKRGCVIV